MKIAVVGSPKSGKTTFSNSMDGNVKHTDDLISLGWSEVSKNASYWFDDDAVNVVEGVAVARALRKWLSRNKSGKPVDKIIFLINPPFQKLSDGQLRMAKGIVTVWDGIVGELLSRGVVIEKKCLTKPAPDARDSAASGSIVNASSESTSQGLS
jgi:KaiC/GvpD/RAD55 family RecA-like ATPase